MTELFIPTHRGARGHHFGRGQHSELRPRVFHLFIRGWSYAAIGRELGISRERVRQMLIPGSKVYARVKAEAMAADGTVYCRQCGIVIRTRHNLRGARWGAVHEAGNWGPEPDRFDRVDRLVLVCRSCEMMNHSGGRGEAG